MDNTSVSAFIAIGGVFSGWLSWAFCVVLVSSILCLSIALGLPDTYACQCIVGCQFTAPTWILPIFLKCNWRDYLHLNSLCFWMISPRVSPPSFPPFLTSHLWCVHQFHADQYVCAGLGIGGYTAVWMCSADWRWKQQEFAKTVTEKETEETSWWQNYYNGISE